ncbi:hypothetical protein B0H19DRAFT_1085988 [Mycena capillaripes]|nr:hypothetical protein B0H19DRAFT_1085988 [Mycena capillaripes]
MKQNECSQNRSQRVEKCVNAVPQLREIARPRPIGAYGHTSQNLGSWASQSFPIHHASFAAHQPPKEMPTTTDEFELENIPSSGQRLLPSSQNSGIMQHGTQRIHDGDSAFTHPRTLRLWGLGLHLTLVFIHLVLLAIWAKKLEHRAVFALEHQTLVSFLVTTFATGFGTMNRSLTALHYNAAAWTGIGSAFLHTWYQKAVPASVLGVLTISLYLADIAVLHITTPALFSVQAFNSSHAIMVSTNQSIPGWKWDIGNFTDDTSWVNITTYALAASAFLPFIGSTDPVGLSKDALSDVLTIQYSDRVFDIHSTPHYSIEPGLLKAGSIAEEDCANVLILYSTIPVLDSEGNNGTWIDLTVPMNSSVSTLQFFECYQSVIPQDATVDAKTGQLITTPRGPACLSLDDPDILNSTGDILVDSWAIWFDSMAPSSIALELELDKSTGPFLSVADHESTSKRYLAQKLDLLALDRTARPTTLALHDVENALSSLVASFLWTRHASPLGVQFTDNGPRIPPDNSENTLLPAIGDPPNRPFIAQGSASVTQQFVKIRLNLSIVAVAVGFAASIALTILALPLIRFQPDAMDKTTVSVGGTGVLHSIWLYRNHPELETLLPQVDDPTDTNLRKAGMVRTTDGGVAGRRNYD